MMCRAQKLNEYIEAKKSFQIRITGGEPFLSQERWDHIVEVLNILDRRLHSEQPYYSKSLDDRLHDYGQRGRPKRKRVVIQTNGILLGKIISLSDLADTLKNLERISILVHQSLKGSKPVEFHLLTQGNAKLFNHQVGLISELVSTSRCIDNFDFQIVFGFFHSDKFILWNPQEDEAMLTGPDSSFLKEVKRNLQRTYVEPLDFRMRMIQKAQTVGRCFDKGIVKKRSTIPKSIISQLDPLPCAGKKARINRTFWRRFLLV